MPNRQGPGFIEEMMRAAPQRGMPPQGGPAPAPAPAPAPGGLEPGPMGPERMVPGAVMIIELEGVFFLVPAVDEQGRALDEGGAVEHFKRTGLFFALSRDPQALVAYAEQAMMKNQGQGQARGQGQGPQGIPPQSAPAPAPEGFSPF